MTSDTKEQPTVPVRKIYAESRGKYILLDNNLNYMFEFPGQATLEDNFAALAYMKDEILKAIQAKINAEKEAVKGKEKPFSEVTDEAIEEIEKEIPIKTK